MTLNSKELRLRRQRRTGLAVMAFLFGLIMLAYLYQPIRVVKEAEHRLERDMMWADKQGDKNAHRNRLYGLIPLSAAQAAASAPASAASAPANAASAPVLTAPQPAAVVTPTQAASDDDAATYEMKPGDGLIKVFGVEPAERVCKMNKENGKVKDCDKIAVKTKLDLPAGITPRAVKAKAKRAAPQDASPKAPRVVRRQPMVNDAGEILYRSVGTAPLNGCGKRDILAIAEEAWSVLGISEEDRVWLRSNIDAKHGPRFSNALQGFVKLVPDMRLERVTFCRQGKVVSIGPMRTAWSKDDAVYGEKFVLPSGKTLVWMRNCFNWVPWIPEEQPAPQPRKDPPQEDPPKGDPPRKDPPQEDPPRDDPPPGNPPEQPKIVAAPRGMCDHLDPSAVIGQEHEPRQNGADSHSTFATASLYCLRPFETANGETGVHGFGAKANYSEWHGSVNNGAGHYRGWNTLVGPSYKRIMDEGYDWEFSVGAGKQVETYRQAAYASRREFDLVGVTVGHNDYRRRLAGETWDVERQYFGALTLPVGKKVGHTLFGQQLADTAELGRFNFGFQAGARWWFYENTDEFPLLPYLQGGVFVQHPTSASMSLRIGVSDPDRICGVGIGIDQDLMHGGDPVGAWGWWCDLVKGGQVVRTKVRKHQVITDAATRGITIEEKGGFIQVIRFGEPTK